MALPGPTGSDRPFLIDVMSIFVIPISVCIKLGSHPGHKAVLFLLQKIPVITGSTPAVVPAIMLVLLVGATARR